MTKLTKYEQETILLYNEEESEASVYTHDPKLLAKLERLAAKYPDKVRLESGCPDAATYIVPKRCVQVREPYSEARRAAASRWAKEAGIRPPARGTDPKTE